MTFRRILPYLLTIILFLVIYLLTMIIPNHILYLGLANDWPEVIKNDKIPLQKEFFVHAFPFVLLAINLLEIISIAEDKFLLRCLKSFLTIICTYILGYVIFHLLHTKVWNMYYHPRVPPDLIFMIGTIFLTGAGMVLIEIVKPLVFLEIDQSRIRSYIPLWLQLERL